MKYFKFTNHLFLIIGIIIIGSCDTNNKTADKPAVKNNFQLVKDFKDIPLTKNDINRIRMDIKFGDSSALSMMLTEDGSIGRQGSGSLPSINKTSLGVTDTALFNALINEFDENKLNEAGIYNYPNIKGDPIKYTLVLMGERPKVKVFEFNVGSENNDVGDLYPYIKNYINKAVVLTDKWYQESLKE